jgi:HK97 family phage prohead protease
MGAMMERQLKHVTLAVSDEAKREITIIASDETPDRYGDIVRVDGWKLANYKKNPVLLFAHNSSEPPIGTAKVEVQGKRLMATAQFLAEGVYDFADTIWRIVRAGALRAASVGFLPLEDPIFIRDEKNQSITGFEYVSQELLELSIVPVPANPAALVQAKSMNLNSEYLRKVFVEESAHS